MSRSLCDSDEHPVTELSKAANFPFLRYFPNLRLLEPRVLSRQAPREQLLHQASLDDLHLVDDRLGLLDCVVHRGEDGGNLALLGKGWNTYLKLIEDVAGYALSAGRASHL